MSTLRGLLGRVLAVHQKALENIVRAETSLQRGRIFSQERADQLQAFVRADLKITAKRAKGLQAAFADGTAPSDEGGELATRRVELLMLQGELAVAQEAVSGLEAELKNAHDHERQLYRSVEDAAILVLEEEGSAIERQLSELDAKAWELRHLLRGYCQIQRRPRDGKFLAPRVSQRALELIAEHPNEPHFHPGADPGRLAHLSFEKLFKALMTDFKATLQLTPPDGETSISRTFRPAA